MQKWSFAAVAAATTIIAFFLSGCSEEANASNQNALNKATSGDLVHFQVSLIAGAHHSGNEAVERTLVTRDVFLPVQPSTSGVVGLLDGQQVLVFLEGLRVSDEGISFTNCGILSQAGVQDRGTTCAMTSCVSTQHASRPVAPGTTWDNTYHAWNHLPQPTGASTATRTIDIGIRFVGVVSVKDYFGADPVIADLTDVYDDLAKRAPKASTVRDAETGTLPAQNTPATGTEPSESVNEFIAVP